jgi:hypothetical protein
MKMRTEAEYIKCIETTSRSIHRLKNLPYDLRTQAICLAAVKRNGQVFRYVPYELRTVEICLEALQRWDKAIQFIPAELLKNATIRGLQEIKGGNGMRTKTEQEYLEIVRQDGYALQYVPWERRTAKLCLAAVQQNDWALHYVPVELQAAVRQALQAAEEQV